MTASSWVLGGSLRSVLEIYVFSGSTSAKSLNNSSSDEMPIARRRVVAAYFLRRSILTSMTSFLEMEKSNHEPNNGRTSAKYSILPVLGSVSPVKYTPGDLTI